MAPPPDPLVGPALFDLNGKLILHQTYNFLIFKLVESTPLNLPTNVEAFYLEFIILNYI